MLMSIQIKIKAGFFLVENDKVVQKYIEKYKRSRLARTEF